MNWTLALVGLGALAALWLGMLLWFRHLIRTAPLLCERCELAHCDGHQCSIMTRSASCAAEQSHDAQGLEKWRTYIESIEP